MLTRRGLFRRAAQTAIAAPLAVVATNALPLQFDPEPEPEPRPEGGGSLALRDPSARVVGHGTGGDVQITAGNAGSSHAEPGDITLQRALHGQARGG